MTAKDPGQNNLMQYQYTYDKMDNITNRNTEHGSYGYAYDDLYRLTAVDNPTLADEGFSYDAVGNRMTSTDTIRSAFIWIASKSSLRCTKLA